MRRCSTAPSSVDAASIAAHSLVVGGTKIPDEVFVTGSPAKVAGPIAGTGAEMWVNINPGAYQDLARRYLVGLEGRWRRLAALSRPARPAARSAASCRRR